MNARNGYIFRPVPRGADYRAILLATANMADRFGVIVRSEKVHLSVDALRLLDDLCPYSISVAQVDRWPGSQLSGPRRSTCITYACNPSAISLLMEAADSFNDWVNPFLPEDLHFLRADGSVVLGTIAQENQVWTELSQQEAERLRGMIPGHIRLRMTNP